MLLNLLAQLEGDLTSSTLEWDAPLTWTDWIPIGLILIAMVSAIWFAFRDTRSLSPAWRAFLLATRLGFLGAALAIALNPHERTQTDAYRDSRVILLADISQSMQQPQDDPRNTNADAQQSRAQAVQSLLQDSELLQRLQADHAVDVYTFGSELGSLAVRFPSKFQDASASSANEKAAASTAPETPTADWAGILQPRDLTTRLGDSLDALLAETKSPTLSGIVILTDGASNAGRDVISARDRAQAQGVRLISVGLGSTTPPVNLEVVKIIAPTDVQKGDEFDLSVILRGQGIAGRQVQLELLQQGPGDAEPVVSAVQETIIQEDGAAAEVQFALQPPDAGDFEFTVRARLPEGVETRDDDNQLSRRVSIFDRPLRVLAIAGGPMRDYHFARAVLQRHPSIQLDLWLQTGQSGASQDANKILSQFPETAQDLYQYDAVLAFDANWAALTPGQQELLLNWVSNEGGGLILIAGDIYTPVLALENNPELETIRKLNPVRLEPVNLQLGGPDKATTPFPLRLTQEGAAAEFLNLNEVEGQSAWSELPGIYRTYPTRGAKAGATVYAEFSDPLARGIGGQPIVIAGQRYGQGQAIYLGSPEMWRLRAIDDAYLDRLWVKLVRKVAEGRSKRGLQRNMFIMEGRDFQIGQAIPIRLRALNAQFQPLQTDSLRLNVFGPPGASTAGVELLRDPIRPAEYVGEFRPLLPGRFRIEFDGDESGERITYELDVQIPRQEAAVLVQDVRQLQRLTDGTGGAVLTLADAVASLPSLLPNKGERVVIDQQIRELWDRGWLMFLMAALLSVEWLTRKLLKLA